MKKIFSLILLFAMCFSLSSCFQNNSDDDDDDLRTVPITNNPQLIPNYTSGGPQMPGGSA